MELYEKRTETISMKTKLSVRIKIKHIADFNDRSISNQIERFLKEKITEWEKKYGPIPLPEQP